jgi:hypothetical protein
MQTPQSLPSGEHTRAPLPRVAQVLGRSIGELDLGFFGQSRPAVDDIEVLRVRVEECLQ